MMGHLEKRVQSCALEGGPMHYLYGAWTNQESL